MSATIECRRTEGKRLRYTDIMPTVLMHTLGSAGDFNPFIALAFELEAIGYDVHFVVNPANAEKLQQIGFRATGVGIDPDWNSDLFRRLLMTSAVSPIEILFREMLIPSIVPAYEAFMDFASETDAFISHSIQLAAPAFAHKSNIPWITAIPATSCFPTAEQPPPCMALNGCPEFLSRIGWNVANLLFQPLDTLANREYEKIGAPRGCNVVTGGAYSRELTVGMWSPAYFPRPNDWPTWMQVGGYGRWDGPAPSTAEPVVIPNGSGPLIVFTLGSSVVNHPGRFYNTAVDALASTDWRGLLIGAPDDFEVPTELRDRIKCTRYARYGDVFAMADAVVHQGGVGTTQTACYFGTPAVIVPRGFDQFENAAHLQRNGWGLRLQPKDLTADLLRRRLSRLLQSESIKESVGELGVRMRAEFGAATSAGIIAEQLKAKGICPSLSTSDTVFA